MQESFNLLFCLRIDAIAFPVSLVNSVVTTVDKETP